MSQSVSRLCVSHSCVSGPCTAQTDAIWLAPNSQGLASTHLFRKLIPHVCVFPRLSGFRCPCVPPGHHICACRCANALCSHKSASWQRSYYSSNPLRRCSLAVGSAIHLQVVILHNMLYLYKLMRKPKRQVWVVMQDGSGDREASQINPLIAWWSITSYHQGNCTDHLSKGSGA